MTDVNDDRIVGSVLGLALGDACGAPYEGGLLERALWALIGKRGGKLRWTDDTSMTVDVIESLVACGKVDQDDLAQRFAESYSWSRGYGPGAAKVLKRIRKGQPWSIANRSVYANGSFGNGGAMRAPVIGLFLATADEDELVEAAQACALVTHAHPLGYEGAGLIALATALAYHNKSSTEIIARLCRHTQSHEYLSRLDAIGAWLQSGEKVGPQTAAAKLGNSVAATHSCVTALYGALAFRNSSFEELLSFTIELGGDVDTIAAMAGAIWGAARGSVALPQARLDRLEQCDRLRALAHSLAVA